MKNEYLFGCRRSDGIKYLAFNFLITLYGVSANNLPCTTGGTRSTVS